MRFVKRVNERGNVTLPAEVRAVLGIGEGDIVELEVVQVLRPRNHRETAQNVDMAAGAATHAPEPPTEVSS